jgi:hypothetical protein
MIPSLRILYQEISMTISPLFIPSNGKSLFQLADLLCRFPFHKQLPAKTFYFINE